MSDQTKLLPVKTSNLLDNCPMTDCYFQACCELHLMQTLSIETWQIPSWKKVPCHSSSAFYTKNIT